MAVKKNTIVNFTFTELFRDLNHDKIFLFILCYEYSLNFNQILTLYEFSPEIFWSYINILKPILKISDRKAQILKKSANNVYFKLIRSKVKLSDKELEYVHYLSQYINDSFTDGEKCLHISQLKKFPIKAKGYFINSSNYREISEIILNSVEELFKYIDSIESIEYRKVVYNKTSRLEYMVEKYYPDVPIKELRLKNVSEMIEMLSSKSIKEHYDSLKNLADIRNKAREDAVYGSQEKVLH